MCKAQHEDELRRNEASVNQIKKVLKFTDIDQPTITALKDCYHGLSDGYRAIEDHARQQQRQRTTQHRRDEYSL